MTAVRGFVPVLTFRFPLDELLVPYVERLSPAALYSAAELPHRRKRAFPRLPLLIDSGGYAALDRQNQVQDEGGLGVLVFPDGMRLTPQSVQAMQGEHAHTGFTLDFPCPAGADEGERARRHALSLANARWALSQPRSFLLYASVQPGQDPTPFLAMRPDGLALGGLAPFSRDRERLIREVLALRAQMPAALPLHVFGIGHPESVRAVLEAGATSVDSSACQRLAADGRSWTGETLTDPSPNERLRLALSNLLTVTHAQVPLSLHPLWSPDADR